jgi:putative permease
MFSMIEQWYQRKFSDPDALMLLIFILSISIILVVWGGFLMPVLIAVVLAYLLDGIVTILTKKGASITIITAVILFLFIGFTFTLTLSLLPTVSQQSINFIEEIPVFWQQIQSWLVTLPESYPELIQAEQIENIMGDINLKLVGATEDIISISFASLVNIGALLIYLILVPLMMFFMLKDKDALMSNIGNLLPTERRLIRQVANEMNVQIANYIRGKVIEIIIVGAVSCVAFVMMDLRYGILLGVLVGLSVLIPYIGAAVVTIPVALVAFIQWGWSAEFGYLMLVYAIIQALDGNLLVPLLFSEAVSLHPLYIIIAVLFFGGIWGFWGVFFAIPLATLVKALIHAWTPEWRSKVEHSESSDV